MAETLRQICHLAECLSGKELQGGLHAGVEVGNSLAVRLPAAVVDALEFKDGDQIEVRIAGPREFEISRDRSREAAIERLRRLRRPLPAGYTFDRVAANER
jgi:antitoxin MazE